MLVVVPKGMVPGPNGYPQAFPGPSLCDVSANANDGVPPSAWVEVTISPVDPSSVTRDEYGRLLHCLWTFARPTRGRRKRRQYYPQWQPTGYDSVGPIQVETDPGTFWVGTDASVAFVGGVPGDEYEVSITYAVTRDNPDLDLEIDVYEPAFQFRLTSVFSAGRFVNFPPPPPFHTSFLVVNGDAQVVNASGMYPIGNALTNAIPVHPVPLNLGQVQVNTGAYQSLGAL